MAALNLQHSTGYEALKSKHVPLLLPSPRHVPEKSMLWKAQGNGSARLERRIYMVAVERKATWDLISLNEERIQSIRTDIVEQVSVCLVRPRKAGVFSSHWMQRPSPRVTSHLYGPPPICGRPAAVWQSGSGRNCQTVEIRTIEVVRSRGGGEILAARRRGAERWMEMSCKGSSGASRPKPSFRFRFCWTLTLTLS